MKLLTTLLAALLALSFVAAEINITVVRHDTDVQSTYQNLKTCSCGATVDSFRIKNIGDLEAHYVFQLEGDQPWFTLERNDITLAPGETRDIYIFTQAPCDAVENGHYTVYVASEYGRYRAFEKNIQTGVCQNIDADMQPLSAEVQPCSEQLFTLSLTNVGTFRETYAISGLSFPTSVTLDAGERTSIVGGYTASCSEYGEKDLPVTITSMNNGLVEKRSVHVVVPRAYDYSIALGDVASPVCAGVPTSIPVFVHNNEDRANSVTLNGKPWNAETTVSVPGKLTAVTTLTFTPTESGERTYTVRATGGNGSIEKSASTVLPVAACYDMTVSAPESVTACAGTLQIPFQIHNTGTQSQHVALDVQSNATTRIDSLQADINPGQLLTKTIGMDVPDADRTYYITLAANNSYQQDQATTLVHGYSTETCYRVAPTQHNFRVWTDATMVPVILKQTGIQPGTYTVDYEGDFMRPLERELTLAPGQQAVLHFTVNATGLEPGRYINRLTLRSHGVDYTTDFGIKLAEKGAWEHFLDACRWNGEFAVCSATSIGSALLALVVLILVVGVLAGFIIYERPVRFSKETTLIIGAALLVILLIIMLATAPVVPRTYERPIAPANNSDLWYELGEGQSMTLDLTTLFADPDKDQLTFTASQPEHLRVTITGQTATILASKHYRGMDQLVFTASDRRGGLTDSDIISVSVVPYTPVSVLEYWQYACWFLTALFLFIAVGVGLLGLLFLGDEKKHAHSGAWVLYRRPRTHIIKGDAHELVASADTRIQTLPPGTTPGAVSSVIGTQVQAGQIVINQGDQEQIFVASADGTRFHRITCPVVKGMPKDKRVTFQTREDAIKAGYTPCKTCSSH